MTDAVKPAPDGVVISRELLAFLCGDGPLDGHYFGEKPEHERGNFWWRKALRAAENAALEQAGEPVADDPEFREYVRKAGQRLAPHSADPLGSPTRDALVWINAALHPSARERVPLNSPIMPNAEAPLFTLQRLGQEFDAGEPDAWRHGEEGFCWRTFDSKEAAISWGLANGIRTDPVALYAHPPQSRGQAFDGEGEAAALRIGWWNDMRRRGVSQENAILAINAALSSAKRGEQG